MEFSLKYCRLCAIELSTGGVSIFGSEGKRLRLSEKIRKTLGILVLEEDILPKRTCQDCCSSLEDYDKYKRTVSDAQETLMSIAKRLENKKRKDYQVLSPEVNSDVTDFDDNDYESELNSPVPGVRPAVIVEQESHASRNNRSDLHLQDLSIKNTDSKPQSSSSCLIVSPSPIIRKLPEILCGLCGYGSDTQKGLLNHHESIHVLSGLKQDPIFQCSRCPKVTKSYQALRKHACQHRMTGAFPCPEPGCERTYTLKGQLDSHRMSRHSSSFIKSEGKAFSCKKCGKRFQTKTGAFKHIKGCHFEQPRASSTFSEDMSQSTVYSPEHEDEDPVPVPEQPTLQSPQKSSENNAISSSQESPSSSNTKNALPSITSIAIKSSPVKNSKLQCQICDKMLGNRKSLRHHIAVHKGVRFSCNDCDASYTQQGELTYHRKVHHSNLPKTVKCLKCSKTFHDFKHMKRHMRSHLEPSSEFHCRVCNKVYKSATVLRNHMRSMHFSNQMTQYPCRLCNKSFKTKQKLTEHEHVHGNKRPYGCPFCEMAFNSNANYHKHAKRRHADKIQGNTPPAPQMLDSVSSSTPLPSGSNDHNVNGTSVSTITSSSSPTKGEVTVLSIPGHSAPVLNLQSGSSVDNITTTSTNNTPVSSSLEGGLSIVHWTRHDLGQLSGGKNYQNPSGNGNASAMNAQELVDCAIHNALGNEQGNQNGPAHVQQHVPAHHVLMHTSSGGPVTSAHMNTTHSCHPHVHVHGHTGNHSIPAHQQNEPMELSYKDTSSTSNNNPTAFQDMPMELTKVFQRDPLELCVRQDFNAPLIDLSSRDASGLNCSMNIGINGNSMSGMLGYHKFDLTEMDLSGAFRQPIDLIAREDHHDLCTNNEGSLVDLSLRSSFAQDQSTSSFIRELIDLSTRNETFHGELNLTSKQTQNNHNSQHHHHPISGSSSSNSNHARLVIANPVQSQHSSQPQHQHSNQGNSAPTFQNVVYQDTMFSLNN